MLTPTGWYVCTAPIDLRCGVDRLLLTIRDQLGQDPFAGTAFVFRNRAGTRIKVVLADVHGVWLCVRRLHDGRFVWPRTGDACWQLDAWQFEWLSSGFDWQRMSLSKLHATAI
jgi:transposase